MVELVNREQRITTGILYPEATYSRVIGFYTGVLPAAADEGWECTGVVGERVWLLEAQLKLWSHDIGVQCRGYWLLLTGTALPSSTVELYGSWDRIIPCSSRIKPYFQWDGVEAQFTWSMRRLYTGSGRRFGLWIANLSNTRWWAQATFKISEG